MLCRLGAATPVEISATGTYFNHRTRVLISNFARTNTSDLHAYIGLARTPCTHLYYSTSRTAIGQERAAYCTNFLENIY